MSSSLGADFALSENRTTLTVSLSVTSFIAVSSSIGETKRDASIIIMRSFIRVIRRFSADSNSSGVKPLSRRMRSYVAMSNPPPCPEN